MKARTARSRSTALGAFRRRRADDRDAQEASVIGVDDLEPDTVPYSNSNLYGNSKVRSIAESTGLHSRP